MNNRDPFSIRQTKQPFAFLRPAADVARRSAELLNEQLQAVKFSDEEAGQSIDHYKDLAAGGIPNSTYHEASISQDMSSWQPRRVINTEGNGVSEKVVEAITGRKQGRGELPMYKDKPYNYTHSQRQSGFMKRLRIYIIAFAVLVTLAYFIGSSLSTAESPTATSEGILGKLSGSGTNKKDDVWKQRQEQVRDAFKLSWKSYEDQAWGYDVYQPVSKTGKQMVPNGFGWIIVDALDTLILMNLTTEVVHAREWIANNLTYDQDHDVNTFETTIRMLGGLLSAHYLTTTYPNYAHIPMVEGSAGEDLYLEKATDLADRLLGAYDSKSGIPFASVNLAKSKGIVSHDDGGASSTAEAATLQLEMKYLAKLTGEKHYWDVSEKVIQVIDDIGAKDGLVPIFIYANEGTFRGDNIRLGSRGDSYYEYLIKQYLQTEKQEPVYLEMWEEALMGVRNHLLAYSKHANLTILGERPNGLEGTLQPKMDHLVCFMPGTIALGATEGLSLAEAKRRPTWGAKQEKDMALATELMKTCWGMYKVTATGLAPEIAYFHVDDQVVLTKDAERLSPKELDSDLEAEWRADFDLHVQDLHNLQRPETVESLLYMWRITGEERYREWGWEMFQAFIEHTALADGTGYASINNVEQVPTTKRDNMESFWLAETLKYFYLLFGPDDVLPLDQIVFNTEAHPFPKFPLGKLFSTGWKRKSRDASGIVVVEDKVERDPEQAPVVETQVVHVDEVGSGTPPG